MELIIIGSGTCVIRTRRASPGYVLKVGEEVLLLDGGTGTLRKCLEAGVRYTDIDKICYTHLHPDHTMDFIPFLFATKYTPGFTRKEPLKLYGPVGFKNFCDRMVELYSKELVNVEYDITLDELKEEERRFDGWKMATRKMEHTPNAIGYRFESNGRTFVYSGDTDYCEGIVHLARDADVLLLECSFPDSMKVPGHLTPTLAGKIAAEAGVKRLVLTHFYPPCDEEDILTPCRAEFDGEVIKAEDLMRLQV